MDWKRAKTILILLLVLVNLFLLGNLLYTRYEADHAQKAFAEDVASTLSKQGVYIDADQIPRETPRRTALFIQRDELQEQTIAQTLTAGTAGMDTQRGLVTAFGPQGAVSWRMGGILEAVVTLPQNAQHSAASAQERSEKLMEACGLDPDSLVMQSTGDTTRIYQCYNGYRVFNSGLTASWTDVSCSLTGRLYTGTALANESGTEMSPGSVLLYYAAMVQRGEIPAGEILDMECGYVGQTLPASGIKLIPAWRIVTGYGAYDLDAVTGTLLQTEPESSR